MTGPMQGIVQLRAPAAPPALRERRLREGRRRLAVLVASVLALVVIAIVGVAAVAGSDTVPPAEGAAALVPADALAYVHISTDPSRASVTQAVALLDRFPSFPRLAAGVVSRVAAVSGGSGSVAFGTAVRPWLGREAAIAFLNTPSATADSLTVLDVRDLALARTFLARSGARFVGVYRGSRLLQYRNRTELAFAGHFLVLGHDASVRAALDVASGAAPSLAAESSYRRAFAGAPADRVLDAYASGAGLQRLIGARPGILGALGKLILQPALAGIGMTLSPAGHGIRVRVHSVLDPALASLSPHAVHAFSPTLQNVLPAGSALMLDLPSLTADAPRLLSAAATAGIGGQIGPLLQRLGGALAAQGVDLHSVLSIFSRETAVAVLPGASPALVIVARTDHPAQANAQLAGLELPLETLFPPPAVGPGQTPLTGDRQVGGVTVHQLSLMPGLQLDYGVFNGLVVVSTSLDGITAIARQQRTLAKEPQFGAALAARPSRVGSLVFLDSSQLLSLGEQTGIAGGARFAALLPDLQRIHAVGLSSTSGEDDSTAELYLQIP